MFGLSFTKKYVLKLFVIATFCSVLACDGNSFSLSDLQKAIDDPDVTSAPKPNSPDANNFSWSTGIGDSSIHPNNEIPISVNIGALVEAQGSASSQGKNVDVSVKISGNTAWFRSKQGSWPVGEISLSFRLTGEEGNSLDATLDFTVIDPKSTGPGGLEFCRPATPVSENSKIVYVKNLGGNVSELFVFDPLSSEHQQITSLGGRTFSPDIGTDGHVYFLSDAVEFNLKLFQIFRMDIDGNNLCAVTNGKYFHGSVSVSPDATKVVFASTPAAIYVGSLDGQYRQRLIGGNGRNRAAPSWCPDGRIAYNQAGTLAWINPGKAQEPTLLPVSQVLGAIKCCKSENGNTFAWGVKDGEVIAVNLDSAETYTLTAGTEPDPSQDCAKIVFRGSSNQQIYRGDFNGNSLSGIEAITTDEFTKGSPTL